MRADSLPRNLRQSIRLIASTTGSTVNTFLERKKSDHQTYVWTVSYNII